MIKLRNLFFALLLGSAAVQAEQLPTTQGIPTDWFPVVTTYDKWLHQLEKYTQMTTAELATNSAHISEMIQTLIEIKKEYTIGLSIKTGAMLEENKPYYKAVTETINSLKCQINSYLHWQKNALENPITLMGSHFIAHRTEWITEIIETANKLLELSGRKYIKPGIYDVSELRKMAADAACLIRTQEYKEAVICIKKYAEMSAIEFINSIDTTNAQQVIDINLALEQIKTHCNENACSRKMDKLITETQQQIESRLLTLYKCAIVNWKNLFVVVASDVHLQLMQVWKLYENTHSHFLK